MENPNHDLSRRNFLKAGAVMSSAVTLGFSGIFGLHSAQAAEGDDKATISNVAATAETFACTHYYLALTSKIAFSDAQVAYLKAALEAEFAHLDFLNSRKGAALTDTFYFPTGTFQSVTTFGTVTAIAETAFVGAYIAAARRFSKLNDPIWSAGSAQIAVVEGQHLALVRQMAGQLPNNIAFGEPLFYNVSDAVPVLQPVLDGKEGALGKMDAAPVKFPGADAIRKVIGTSTLKPDIKVFTDPTLFSDKRPTPQP